MHPLYTFVCALAAISGVVGADQVLEPRADKSVKTLTKKQVVKYTVTKNHKPVVRSRTITLKSTTTVDANVQTSSWTRHYTTTVNDRRVVATKTVRKTIAALVTPTVNDDVEASRATKTLDVVATVTVKAKTTSKGKVKTVTEKQKTTQRKTITSDLTAPSAGRTRAVSTSSAKPSATSKAPAKGVATSIPSDGSSDGGDDDGDSRIGNPGSYQASASIGSTQLLELAGDLEKVTTTYNNGAKGLTGSFGTSFGTGGVMMGWQASGPLSQGGCDSAVTKAIPDCYSLSLAGNPDKNLAPGYSGSASRQRTEIYVQGVTDDSTWQYTWRTYLDSTATTQQFFHVWQLLTRGEVSGPVAYLDAVNGNVTLRDVARCSSGCAAVPIENFADRVIQHSMTVKFGNDGKMVYTADDYTTGGNIFTYHAQGWMGNVSTSLKFGLYRRAVDGIGNVGAYVGQFTAKQLS